jgi:hypothetical protein
MGRGFALSGLVAAMLLVAAAPAWSTSAEFTESRFGFVPSTLSGQPQLVMDGSDSYLDAGDPITGLPLDVELIGSTNLCILAEGSSDCQANTGQVTGPYSAIMTVEINVLNTAELPGDFTLLLTALGTSYSASEVSIELNPTLPPDFNPAPVPDFVFDPSNGVGGFTPIVDVRDETTASQGAVFHYVGWTTRDGALVTLRYDVSTAPDGRDAPQLYAKATSAVIPEPTAAILMGLGLAGLTLGGRRRS